MAAIRSLCSRAVLLRGGRVADFGIVESIADQYANSFEPESFSSKVILTKPPQATYWIDALTILVNGRPSTRVPMGSELTIQLALSFSIPVKYPKALLIFSGEDSQKVIQVSNRFTEGGVNEDNAENMVLNVRLERIPLCAGNYSITIHLGDIGTIQQILQDVLWFTVEPRDVCGTGRIPHPGNGAIWLNADFSVSSEVVLEQQ
jgi:hypothetical protein